MNATERVSSFAGQVPPLQLSSAAEDTLYRKVILHTVPLFFFGFVLSYLDRVNISLAKLQMQADFGLTDRAFAFGAGIFFWGYILFEIPSNLILKRVGARAWIARIMLTWGFVSMLMIFSRNRTAFYSLRLLLGICEAGFVPGVMYYTNTWLPARRQGRMYSLFLMALPIAMVIGSPLSGYILQSMRGTGGLRGWQWLFLIEGAPSVLLGIAIFLLLRNSPRDVHWLTPSEKDLVEWNVAREASHKLHRLRDSLRTPALYLLITVMLLFNTAFYGLAFWLPSVLRNAGVTNDFHVGLYTAIPFLFASFAMYFTAAIAERHGTQRIAGAVAVAIASVSLLLATLFHAHLLAALAMLTLTASGILALMPLFWALPGRILSGAAAAAGLALINSFGSFSGVLGNFILGFAGIVPGMYVLAASLALCAVLFYLTYPKPAPAEPQ